MDFEYAITLRSVPNYGNVKVLFGLKDKEYNHYDNDGTFIVDVKEIESRLQYRSLKKILQNKGYI